jgi:hypothetical protein
LNEQVTETLYLTSVTLAERLLGIAVLPTPTLHATTQHSPSLRVMPVAALRLRVDTSLRSP